MASLFHYFKGLFMRGSGDFVKELKKNGITLEQLTENEYEKKRSISKSLSTAYYSISNHITDFDKNQLRDYCIIEKIEDGVEISKALTYLKSVLTANDENTSYNLENELRTKEKIIFLLIENFHPKYTRSQEHTKYSELFMTKKSELDSTITRILGILGKIERCSLSYISQENYKTILMSNDDDKIREYLDVLLKIKDIVCSYSGENISIPKPASANSGDIEKLEDKIGYTRIAIGKELKIYVDALNFEIRGVQSIFKDTIGEKYILFENYRLLDNNGNLRQWYVEALK